MNSTVDLNSKCTQQQFATLVGCTQQAIADRLRSGVLVRGDNLGSWLISYCEQLRKEASGRASDKQNQLTEARIEESKENTATKKQARLIAAGNLVQLDDVSIVILELPRFMKIDLLAAGESIHESLQLKYGIQIDEDEVLQPLRATLRHVGDRVQKLQRTIGVDPGGANT